MGLLQVETGQDIMELIVIHYNSLLFCINEAFLVWDTQDFHSRYQHLEEE